MIRAHLRYDRNIERRPIILQLLLYHRYCGAHDIDNFVALTVRHLPKAACGVRFQL